MALRGQRLSRPFLHDNQCNKNCWYEAALFAYCLHLQGRMLNSFHPNVQVSFVVFSKIISPPLDSVALPLHCL